MIAVVRPEDRMVQYAFTGEVLTAVFMLWMALRSVYAVRQDAVALTLGLSFPLFYIFGYLFFYFHCSGALHETYQIIYVCFSRTFYHHHKQIICGTWMKVVFFYERRKLA